MRIPRMVWAGLAVLALDTAALAALLTAPGTGLAPMLFQLATFVGAWGGMEALYWVARESPWRLEDPVPEEGGLAGRLRLVPWTQGAWMRSAVLRLMSGTVVAFSLCMLPFLVPHQRPPEWALLPLFLVLMQVLRLAGPGVSAVLLAPLLLLAGGGAASREDRFHAAVAAGLSAAVIAWVYATSGFPPLLDFLAGLFLMGLNPAHHAYGLMIGGIVWWKITWVGRWMSRGE